MAKTKRKQKHQDHRHGRWSTDADFSGLWKTLCSRRLSLMYLYFNRPPANPCLRNCSQPNAAKDWVLFKIWIWKAVLEIIVSLVIPCWNLTSISAFPCMRSNDSWENGAGSKGWVKVNLDARVLLFRAWLRERRALGNPETGVFLIGCREKQRTRSWLVYSISRENEKFA